MLKGLILGVGGVILVSDSSANARDCVPPQADEPIADYAAMDDAYQGKCVDLQKLSNPEGSTDVVCFIHSEATGGGVQR